MDKFFKGTTFKVLLTVALLLAVATIFGAASSNSTSPITKAVSFVTSPLGKAASYLSAKADGLTGGFVSSESYKKRIEELEGQIAEYRAQLVDYENAKKQLSSYEEFLDVREENPDFEWVYCKVIGRDAADVFSSFTLNKGTNHGIKVNDAVIYSNYLVGVVTEVNPTSCVVRTITDPSVNVAAYEIRTGEIGYVSSSAEQSLKGFCALSGLDKNTSVSKGGIVCTSGTGGIFPKDLIVGTVTEVSQSSIDNSAYAVLEPAADSKDISSCFVITSFGEK